MNPSSAPGESPIDVGGVVTSAAATGAGARAEGLAPCTLLQSDSSMHVNELVLFIYLYICR